MRIDRGFVLLETLLALLLLGVAGTALAAMTREVVAHGRHYREAELEVQSALALLDAVSLWPRADLDRHLGDRRQGSWRVRISHTHDVLYFVTVSDSTGERELLETALYRPVRP